MKNNLINGIIDNTLTKLVATERHIMLCQISYLRQLSFLLPCVEHTADKMMLSISRQSPITSTFQPFWFSFYCVKDLVEKFSCLLLLGPDLFKQC